MPFITLQPCCLKGQTLPGEPKGVFEPPSGDRTVGRYIAKPSDGIISKPNTVVVLLYDGFGFNIPNSKIMADAFADRLKLPVYVIDYILNPLNPAQIDKVLESYPGEKKKKGWLSFIWDWASVVPNIIFGFWGVRDAVIVPMVEKGVAELQAEGFTSIGAVGYCKGGAMVAHLLSKGDECPVKCGVIAHPAPDSSKWPGFTKPNEWHLASGDLFITDSVIASLQQLMDEKKKSIGIEFEYTLYPDTTHGYAIRPDLGHEPTRKAFDETNESTIKFFQKHL